MRGGRERGQKEIVCGIYRKYGQVRREARASVLLRCRDAPGGFGPLVGIESHSPFNF